jgi:hypothetical protein
MTSLDDFLALNKEFDFEGKKYTTQPIEDIDGGEGEFSIWLEQRAYDAIERRTYQDEKQKIEDRRVLNQDVAIGLYEYGTGVVALHASQHPLGIAKVLHIICRRQEMTEAIAKRFVNQKLKEIAVKFISQLPNASQDALSSVLNRYGLPGNFFDLKTAEVAGAKPEGPPAEAPVPTPDPLG